MNTDIVYRSEGYKKVKKWNSSGVYVHVSFAQRVRVF